MKRILSLVMVIALMAVAGAVCAYPSLLGPTGGANLPTANVTPATAWNVAVDYFNQSSNGIDAATSLRVLWGAAENWEVGATYTKQDTDATENLDNWGINAKYVTPFSLGGFAWAGGAVYSDFKDFDLNYTQLYFVGTRVLSEGTETSPAVRGTVGFNWTNVDFGSEKTDAIRPFVDIDLAFKSGANVTAEYQFQNDSFDDKALASLVVRYPFNENWSGQVGMSNAVRGIAGGDDYDLLVGVNYKFSNN